MPGACTAAGDREGPRERLPLARTPGTLIPLQPASPKVDRGLATLLTGALRGLAMLCLPQWVLGAVSRATGDHGHPEAGQGLGFFGN